MSKEKFPFRFFQQFIFLLLALGLSGCAIGLGKSLHQYSSLDEYNRKAFEGRKKTSISHVEEQYVFIDFLFDTDYADDGYKAFLSKCSGGTINNIRVTHSTDLGFFAYRERVRYEGICVL